MVLRRSTFTAGSSWTLPLPFPKGAGRTRPHRKTAQPTALHPRSRGRAPLPQQRPAEGGALRGLEPGTRRSPPHPPPPRPGPLTSTRAGSGPCTATGCCCSCWAGAGGSLFRWLRSSSGPARTAAGAHSSGTRKSRSSRGADARPFPGAAAAIPPAGPAAHGRRKRKCGDWKPRPRTAAAARPYDSPPPPLREQSAPSGKCKRRE